MEKQIQKEWTAARSIERINSILSKRGLKPAFPKRKEGSVIIIRLERSENK